MIRILVLTTVLSLTFLVSPSMSAQVNHCHQDAPRVNDFKNQRWANPIILTELAIPPKKSDCPLMGYVVDGKPKISRSSPLYIWIRLQGNPDFTYKAAITNNVIIEIRGYNTAGKPHKFELPAGSINNNAAKVELNGKVLGSYPISTDLFFDWRGDSVTEYLGTGRAELRVLVDGDYIPCLSRTIPACKCVSQDCFITMEIE
ncbi:MAG: hypothetical protein ACPGOY_10980 [Rhodospirillaceae bacterium]